ncbi:PKD domain-containing protein [Shewanella glacialimarina]|uniref:PKD domain-containing protein n=1 Tax=Shewanella glacialimarina TaxID=2590884 RepID=UPI001CF85BC1|nr:hypothetical protein [Shewanella glacialimarina]UCX03273.1 hypothetical protein FJ709_01275 [Shewanella glacialimarina]
MNKKIIALLIGTSLLAGCNSSDDQQIEPVEQVPENKAPSVIMVAASPLVEKGAGILSVDASDSDGSIATYLWEQTSGPVLTIIGAETKSISFDIPSVTMDTQISFKVTVTDDDGDIANTTIETAIERIETDYQLAGKVVGDVFAGKMLKAVVSTEVAETAIKDDGTFSINLKVDDDIPLTKLVKISTLAATGINLTLLLPSLDKLDSIIFTPSNASKLNNINAQQAATASLTSLSVSAVSTALYSLILASNKGVEPDNINTIELIESQLNPEDVIRSAAVVKILLESDTIVLPEGINNVVDLIANPEALDSFVATITAMTPDLIENEMDAIIADPNLTPPVDSSSVAKVYYQTEPVAPTFLARSGSRYQFDDNGIGKFTDSFGVSIFGWEIKEGKIDITYTNPAVSVSYDDVSALDALSQTDKDALWAAGYTQVEVMVKKSHETFTRLTTGSSVDSYYVETSALREMTPITLGFDTIKGTWQGTSESDFLMRKSATAGAQFEKSYFKGLWVLDVYHPQSYNNVHFERLDFDADGTGVSADTARQYTWTVTDGVLILVFDDFIQTYNVIDALSGDYSTFSEIKSKVGETLAVTFGVVLQQEEGLTFNDTNTVTGAERYWQTTINQWTADSWDGNRLSFCLRDSDTYACENGSVFFGFQTLSDNTGTRYTYAEGVPPSLSNYSGNALSWSIMANNNVIKFEHRNSCWDVEGVCRYREWHLLKIEDGIIGKRFYVQEVDYARVGSEDEWYYFIQPRFNQYELINLEYFNQTAQIISPPGHTPAMHSVYYPSMVKDIN